MSRVFCIGENIIDYIPNGDVLLPMPGGAPCNVCAGVASLGGEAFYLGNISTDENGVLMADALKNAGVRLQYATFDKHKKTAYSVVSLIDGERKFEFFRKDTADLNFDGHTLDDVRFQSGDVLYFCSVCLSDGKIKHAHKKAIDLARQARATVSFDVNLRPSLWNDFDAMMSAVLEFLPYADVLKLSSEEAVDLCNFCKRAVCAEEIFNICKNLKILLITKGKDGVVAYDRQGKSEVCPAYNDNPVDTTGAGDCFVASILYLLTLGKAELTVDGLKYALEFASRACAVEVSKKGAINAMPTLNDVLNFGKH